MAVKAIFKLFLLLSSFQYFRFPKYYSRPCRIPQTTKAKARKRQSPYLNSDFIIHVFAVCYLPSIILVNDVFQSAYMHTTINDPAILVVFELIAKSSGVDEDDDTASDVGCGWGYVRLFKHNVKSVDVTDSAASPASRYILLVCINILIGYHKV